MSTYTVVAHFVSSDVWANLNSRKAISRSAVILYGVNVNANNLSLYNVTLRAGLFVCVCETLVQP